VHDGMKRTGRRKYCNRAMDAGTRGSMNCHLRRLRRSRSDNSSTRRGRPKAGLIGSVSGPKYCNQLDSSVIAVGLNRFTAFHHMKFDPGGGRTRW
jgi:hypothetical protein